MVLMIIYGSCAVSYIFHKNLNEPKKFCKTLKSDAVWEILNNSSTKLIFLGQLWNMGLWYGLQGPNVT